MQVIIHDLHTGAYETIRCPQDTSAAAVAAKYQRTTLHYHVSGNLSPIAWTWIDSDDIVDALKETARF